MILHFIPPTEANGIAQAKKNLLPKHARRFEQLDNRAETRVCRAFGVTFNPFNYRYDARGNVLAIDKSIVRAV